MTRRGVDRFGMAGGGPIAPAIVRHTKMGASLDHLAGDLDVWLVGIMACGFRTRRRICGTQQAFASATSFCAYQSAVQSQTFPIMSKTAVAVGSECGHRRRPFETVVVTVLAREFALPGVAWCRPPGVNSFSAKSAHLSIAGPAFRGRAPNMAFTAGQKILDPIPLIVASCITSHRPALLGPTVYESLNY